MAGRSSVSLSSPVAGTAVVVVAAVATEDLGSGGVKEVFEGIFP